MVEVCSRATLELLTRERLPELTTETRHGRGMQAHTCRLTHTVLASQAYIQCSLCRRTHTRATPRAANTVMRASAPGRRSVLVDSLQKVGMRYRPQRQLWAAAVLLNTRGLELTLLKNYLDDGGDYHTCYKLCYHDLQVGGREGGWEGGRGQGGVRGGLAEARAEGERLQETWPLEVLLLLVLGWARLAAAPRVDAAARACVCRARCSSR